MKSRLKISRKIVLYIVANEFFLFLVRLSILTREGTPRFKLPFLHTPTLACEWHYCRKFIFRVGECFVFFFVCVIIFLEGVLSWSAYLDLYLRVLYTQRLVTKLYFTFNFQINYFIINDSILSNDHKYCLFYISLCKRNDYSIYCFYIYKIIRIHLEIETEECWKEAFVNKTYFNPVSVYRADSESFYVAKIEN